MGKKPNIVIFMTDHQRRETMPGYDWCITPALDAFARDAVTFTNAVCPSPHCCPSRATFFSGLYPSQHGVWNNVEVWNALSRGLSEGVKLWSEDLQENGYRLFFSGKRRYHRQPLHHDGAGALRPGAGAGGGGRRCAGPSGSMSKGSLHGPPFCCGEDAQGKSIPRTD